MPYKTRDAHNAWARKYYATNREKMLEVHRRSRRKNYANVKKANKRRLSTPEGRKKDQAQSKLRRAVKEGLLTRPVGTIFHHPDYDRPYYGAWMTQSDHVALHSGLSDEPQYKDYTDEISARRSAKQIKPALTAILNGETGDAK